MLSTMAISPSFNTIRGQSDLFTVQCCHWDSKADILPPRQHSTLSEDRVISLLFNVVIETQRQIYPPLQHYQRTEWSLYCSMLSLTLKGRYTPPHIQHYQRREWSLHCSMLSLTLKGRYTPPHIQHYQRTEWSLHCSMLSLTLKGRYTPPSTLSEDRVISSLFNVVIDTQRKISPHGQLYQRTEWSLHCSMLSLTLKGRYTPPVKTSRGQNDLFTVQCCHWHSKADISRGQSDLFTVQCCQSTLAEDRVISLLFNVVIDTQRQI